MARYEVGDQFTVRRRTALLPIAFYGRTYRIEKLAIGSSESHEDPRWTCRDVHQHHHFGEFAESTIDYVKVRDEK